MRPINILLLIIFFLFFPFSKGEGITVELVPSSMEVKVGDTLNLDLVVKNVPEDGKCQGFETEIHYNSNILNLTEINLSGVGEGASLKNVNSLSGSISLIWFSNPPYGNFTLATISFEALNSGEANITMRRAAVANEDGYVYGNISTYPATVIVNISIKKEIEEKNITEYSGLTFYVDGYSEETNISLDYSKEIKLKVYNADKNLTNFSGYVFINNSLFNVSDYEVPKYSKIFNEINYSNIIYNNNYLYFNISLMNGTNGTYSILKFTLSPKVNENISSIIHLGNLSLYENNTEIPLPYKNLTVNILKRNENTPPRLKIVLFIENNKKVYFQALGYDVDNETLRYFWDFGDGKNSTLQDPTHLYSNYSTYLISCTVWDNLNKSDKVKFILPIMNVSPLESYSISNKTIFYNNSKNHTVYLNLSLKNPFEYGVMGYINFVDYYNNYHPSKLQYHVELKPNETKNLLIPINITKSCDIKWNIMYYPLYRDKLIKDVELKYYMWNFKEGIILSKYRKKSISESTIYKDYINNYSKILNMSTPDIVVKIRGYGKEYVIYREVVVSTKSIYFYIFASLSGFIIGLVAILAMTKNK